MRPFLFLAIPLAGLSAALPAGTARADEAYVCDGGRIVYVKPGQLESLKHTDACIAGYYGLTVPAAPVAATGATAKQPPAPKITPDKAAMGLEFEREALAATRKPVVTTGAITPKAAPVETRPEPAAVPAGDFRNVLILNAKPGTDRYFRHER